MPFIPQNRGKPEKPPWVRDTSAQQADVPWRRNNVVGKLNIPDKNVKPGESSPPTRPGTSKLQINLKSVQQPDSPSPKKDIPILIQTTQAPPPQTSINRAKEISIPIFKEDSTPIQPPSKINTKSNPPSQQHQNQPPPPSTNNNNIPITIKKGKESLARNNKPPTPIQTTEINLPAPKKNLTLNVNPPSSQPLNKSPITPEKQLKQGNISVIPIQKIIQKPEPSSPPVQPFFKNNLKPVELRNLNPPKNNIDPVQPPPSPLKQINNKMSSAKPPPPPPPPPPLGFGPPPPPPPPGGLPPLGPMTEEKKAKLDKLKKVPKRRPDWSVMMKEIETSRKLKHVECNDRSKPIIPKMKSRGKFVFDSEAKPANKADAIHNRLLTEIASGVKLKKVQCNDRSKPILGGLRKFRRQMTMEEKDKGVTTLDETTDPTTPTDISSLIDIDIDIDDIDTLRDELQSAKQMCELEIQAKILLAKENRDLKCQNILREAEIDELKFQLQQQLSLIPYDEGRRDSRAFKDLRKSKSGLYKCPSGVKKSKSGFGPKGDRKERKEEEEDLGELNELEEEINALRTQIHASKKIADDWEAKHKEASEKLLLAQGKYEDSEQQRLVLEKKMERLQSQKGVTVSSNNKWTQTEEQIQQMQNRRVSRQSSTTSNPRKPSVPGETQDVAEGDDDEFDSDDDMEVDEATVIRKKEEREIKLWENKLRNVKEKQLASKSERKSLKIQQKKLEEELKEQKKRLKELQKEVDKMAKMLKGGTGDDEDEDEEEEEEEEEEDEEDEDEESSSEEEESSSEEEEESSEEDDDPEAPHVERINLFTKRVKRWDNILNALRKGNYLFRANIDRLKDDLEDVRIKYHDLEHELNTVLADV